MPAGAVELPTVSVSTAAFAICTNPSLTKIPNELSALFIASSPDGVLKVSNVLLAL